jgi:ABC-2 type transport system permease protein/capsular polysaccharide transport system permease protein
MMTARATSASGSFRQAWTIQLRVIWALLLRESLTRYGRHNIGFLWLFVEPMLFTLGVTAIWSALKSVHGSSLPIVAFAITGYSSVLLWRNMPSRCVGALEPNLSLLYHRNVKVLDIFISRLLLEAAGATISFVALSVFFMGIGWLSPPEDVLQVAGGWCMIAWFGASLAVLLGAWSEESELVEKLWHPLAYLLFPLSGAGFLVDVLPTKAQEMVLLLPMVHGVEYVREGYFGSQITAHYNMAYMAAWNFALTWFALLMARKVGRTVVPQ